MTSNLEKSLEDQLARVLHDRANLVHTPPAYRLVPDAAPARSRRDRLPQARRRWAFAVSAAAVAAVAAVLLATFLSTRPPDRPSAACVLTQSQPFTAALRRGQLPADAVPLSGSADGALLVARQRAGLTTAVQIVDAFGSVRQVWTAAPGEHVRAVANPSGAISGGFVAFVLAPVHSGSARIVVAGRSSDSDPARVLAPDRGYRFPTEPATAPVGGPGVEILETPDRASTDQKAMVYWADWNQWTYDGRVSGVRQLLTVGGNLVMLRNGAGGTLDVRFGDPKYQPAALGPAMRSGFSFSSDGTTMTWLTKVGARFDLLTWAPGHASPTQRALPLGFTPTAAAGSFALAPSTTAGQEVFDTATSAAVELPKGVTLELAAGATSVVAHKTDQGVRYSRVSTSLIAGCRR